MTVYQSKISYGLLSLITLLFVSIIVFEILNSRSFETTLIPSGILILVSFFMIHLFLSTRYIIAGEILKIRSGFIYKKDLEIKKIISISKTSNIISSPAASFDRIELKYGKFGSVIISPKDKTSFIEHLIKINPRINNQIKN